MRMAVGWQMCESPDLLLQHRVAAQVNAIYWAATTLLHKVFTYRKQLELEQF